MLTITDKHIFFFTEWPSNFKLANFRCNTTNTEDHNFFCSEQAFMYAKAITFSDYDTANKILNCKTPQEAKELGRKVHPYCDTVWSKVRFNHMYQCNLAKYQQNPDLLKLLLDEKFEGKTFVEASPWDPIWGICLSRKDYSIEFIDNEEHWRGQNLLGEVITKVRNDLIHVFGYCIKFDCKDNDTRGRCICKFNDECDFEKSHCVKG